MEISINIVMKMDDTEIEKVDFLSIMKDDLDFRHFKSSHDKLTYDELVAWANRAWNIILKLTIGLMICAGEIE